MLGDSDVIHAEAAILRHIKCCTGCVVDVHISVGWLWRVILRITDNKLGTQHPSTGNALQAMADRPGWSCVSHAIP